MSVDTGLARMSADLFVNGSWTTGKAGWLDNVDPGNGRTIGAVSLAGADQVAEAIEAAEVAFPAWSARPAVGRGRHPPPCGTSADGSCRGGRGDDPAGDR